MSDVSLQNISRVVAIVEPESERQPSIERLTVLARSFDFEVLLVACDYSQYLVEGYYFSEAELPALRKEYLDERKELLESLAEPLREAGMTVSTQAIWSHPSYKGVVGVIDEFQPDLVIHHVHRHGALSRMLLTNDDWQLARHCTAPLLLVKDKPWKAAPVILGAVDPMHSRHKPSGLDHGILKTGRMLEESLSGVLYVAHAYGQYPLSGIYPFDAQAKHTAALTALTEEFDFEDTRVFLMDEAPEFALKTLEEELQIDLLIVGSISRSILADVFIGSTTEKILDYLDCDALLLRPDNN